MSTFTSRRLRGVAGALSFVLLSALSASAGGPVLTCGSGVPVLWLDGGANIPFNPDRGNLGPLDNAAAVAAVQDAFDVWAAVPSATVTYANVGALPVDVDITNFAQYLFEPEPDGLDPVVFDDTGEIFDAIFGPNSGVLGVAGANWFDADALPCTHGNILEALAVLNGPAFADAVAAKDVMVHEFGHYSGLAHTVVNGQNVAFADPTGPAPFTFGDAPLTAVETMYPFYFGPGSGTQTLEKDDVAAISRFYPEPSYFGSTGTISGTILAPNGTSGLTGINVVARNVDDPIHDAVSGISGDTTFDDGTPDPRAGTYTLTGLTPGAHYAVYIDGILDGGFSTTPRRIPGREEFFSGANESADPTRDDPTVFAPVTAVAGQPAAGSNIIVNRLAPGPIPLGFPDAVEIFPPFRIRFCGIDYESFFVNSTGVVSFGEPDTFVFNRTESLLRGAPMIAGLITHLGLDPTAGGTVSFSQTTSDVTVRFDGVPESFQGGPNTFSIRMTRSPLSAWETKYGDLGSPRSFGGFSCGGRVTSGFEKASRLAPVVVALDKTAVWEGTTPTENHLANHTFRFLGPGRFRDTFEGESHHRNDTFDTATPIELPFQSARAFSTIEPLGGDVDYYRFQGNAGDIVAIEAVPGNPTIQTVVGLFRRGADGRPVLVEDADLPDAHPLSAKVVRLPSTATYAVAVTTRGDTAFTGAGTDFGRYNLSVVKYHGDVVHLSEFGTVEVPLGFSFPFQGRTWPSVFVNGPGSLTFGEGDGDPFLAYSVPHFLEGPPRIAPLSQDYVPEFGVVLAEHGRDSLSIHYISVWGLITDRPNYFSTEMRKDGRVKMTYHATDAERGSGIAGLTPGGGAPDPGPTDLSRGGRLSARGTTYESFGFAGNEVDLFFRTLTFLP